MTRPLPKTLKVCLGGRVVMLHHRGYGVDGLDALERAFLARDRERRKKELKEERKNENQL